MDIRKSLEQLGFRSDGTTMVRHIGMNKIEFSGDRYSISHPDGNVVFMGSPIELLDILEKQLKDWDRSIVLHCLYPFKRYCRTIEQLFGDDSRLSFVRFNVLTLMLYENNKDININSHNDVCRMMRIFPDIDLDKIRMLRSFIESQNPKDLHGTTMMEQYVYLQLMSTYQQGAPDDPISIYKRIIKDGLIEDPDTNWHIIRDILLYNGFGGCDNEISKEPSRSWDKEFVLKASKYTIRVLKSSSPKDHILIEVSKGYDLTPHYMRIPMDVQYVHDIIQVIKKQCKQ